MEQKIQNNIQLSYFLSVLKIVKYYYYFQVLYY